MAPRVSIARILCIASRFDGCEARPRWLHMGTTKVICLLLVKEPSCGLRSHVIPPLDRAIPKLRAGPNNTEALRRMKLRVASRSDFSGLLPDKGPASKRPKTPAQSVRAIQPNLPTGTHPG